MCIHVAYLYVHKYQVYIPDCTLKRTDLNIPPQLLTPDCHRTTL